MTITEAVDAFVAARKKLYDDSLSSSGFVPDMAVGERELWGFVREEYLRSRSNCPDNSAALGK